MRIDEYGLSYTTVASYAVPGALIEQTLCAHHAALAGGKQTSRHAWQGACSECGRLHQDRTEAEAARVNQDRHQREEALRRVRRDWTTIHVSDLRHPELIALAAGAKMAALSAWRRPDGGAEILDVGVPEMGGERHERAIAVEE